MSQVSGTGQRSRYQRSFGGLIGSMIVLVVIVVGYVIIRGGFRTTPTYDPEPVDYRSLIVSLQQNGLTPAYPDPLPDGWFVKQATFDPGDRPVLDLAITTADGHFAGLHEEDADVDDLVDSLVGRDATETGIVALDTPVAPRWRSFAAPDGDHAFAAEVGRQSVLVYGSAPVGELRTLVETLSTAKLKP